MNLSIREIVIAGMLGAISIILGATGLGLIPVPTPAGHATIMHVPVILGGILEGPLVGMLIGLIFGIFSFLRATNPIFADPLIAILPRLIIGIGAYYSFILVSKWNQNLGLIIAGITGSAINTIFVLGLAVIRDYLPISAAWATAGLHGIPEAILAAVITTLVGSALIMYREKN